MRFYPFLILLSILFSGCISHKRLKALNIEDELYKIETDTKDYKLMDGDLLSINVYSIDPKSVAIFNRQIGGGISKQLNEASIYANSYIIDDGKILLPVIGYVEATGKNISEFKKDLELRFSEHYKLFSLDVKLLSFRLTVLGEVGIPGAYTVFNDNINVMQAIGKAGGFTDYSNKANIKLIRRVSLGNEEVHTLNLQEIEKLDLNYYYLLPNDVIYVEPLKPKVFKVNYTAVQAIISTITLTFLALNFFSN